MNKEVIPVDEAVVCGIQLKDEAYKALLDVHSSLLESHAGDADASFMDSPVVRRFQEEIAGAKAEWDRAKDAMLRGNVPAGRRGSVRDWTLDYGLCELTIIY